MSTTAKTTTDAARRWTNKVPEVTIWFWVVKVLCTTVGESLADWVNTALGVGLTATAALFTAIMAATLFAQMRLRRHVPGVYWLTVVVLSITGTLYTDILTDQLGVPLGVSSTVFAVVLAVVFGAWYARERTLSIHTIDTPSREAFYWLAVLVTFALGTATGDGTLELTGWGPGPSILLPLTLIAVVAGLWRYGADPILTFWIAYVLTRPLGANIGDFLGLPQDQQGLGLGTLLTSVVFLAAILAIVIRESVRGAATADERAPRTPHPDGARRRRVSLVVLGVVAAATVALLSTANALPHRSALADEGGAPVCDAGSGPLTQADASAAAAAHFPAADVARLRLIVDDTMRLVRQGDQTAAKARATDLETAWDDGQDALNAADCRAWAFLDGKIDPALSAVRAGAPDPGQEQAALQTLLDTLPAS